MIIVLTSHTILNTALTEIEVTIIASAAVIVLIWNSNLTIVAVNGEDIERRGRGKAGVIADSILTIIIDASKFSKPPIASRAATGNWDIGARHLGYLLGNGCNISLQCTAAGAGAEWSLALTPTRLVDKEFLKSTLNLGDGAWGDPACLLRPGNRICGNRRGLFGVGSSDMSLRSSCGRWNSPSRLLLGDRAD